MGTEVRITLIYNFDLSLDTILLDIQPFLTHLLIKVRFVQSGMIVIF